MYTDLNNGTEDSNRMQFREHTWSREELFLNVSHNTVDETYKFPCNAVDGPKMGAPCSFPALFPDCSESVKPICLQPK